MKLSIITTTFNNEDTINNYLSSLLKNIPPQSEVIVVDNKSFDNTLEKLNEFKKITLIKNNENLGFAKACNIGALNARGEYLFFLNPDIEVVGDSISCLLSFISKDSSIGVLAPKLVLKNGDIQNSVRKLPTLSGAIKEYIFGVKSAYSEYVPESLDPIEIEAAYGAAVLIRKELFNKIKGFDERYFMYYEDLDLCRRIRNLGFKIKYYPKAVFKHEVGGSSKNAERVKIPLISRISSNFIPIRKTGSYYFQVKSASLYHGFIKAFLIHLIIYISLKLKLHVFR